MNAVLVIATLGAVALGFFIMRRIDAFIEGGGFLDSPHGRANAGFLVFGSHAEAERLRRAGFRCVETEVPDIVAEVRYAALFAVSDSDEDNLLMCRNAKAYDPGMPVIARCGSARLREAYLGSGADRVLAPGETLDALLSELRGIRR